MRRRWVLALLAAVSVSTCSTPDAGDSVYELKEFEINGPLTAPAGASTLTVTNTGVFPHTLVIADEGGRVVAATGLVQPGETSTLDVELTAGTFQFTCRIVSQKPDGEIVDHFEEGMVATVTAGS